MLAKELAQLSLQEPMDCRPIDGCRLSRGHHLAQNQMLDLRFDVREVTGADEVEMLQHQVRCGAFIGGAERPLFEKEVGLRESNRRWVPFSLLRYAGGGYCRTSVDLREPPP